MIVALYFGLHPKQSGDRKRDDDGDGKWWKDKSVFSKNEVVDS